MLKYYFNHHKTQAEFNEYLSLKKELDDSIAYSIDKTLKYTADDFSPDVVTQDELTQFQEKMRPKLNRFNFLKTQYGYQELLAKLKKARKASGYRRQKPYEVYITEENAKNNIVELCQLFHDLDLHLPDHDRLMAIQKNPDLLNEELRKNDISLLDDDQLGFIQEAPEALAIIYDLWRFHAYTLDESYVKTLKQLVQYDKIHRYDLAESLQKSDYDEGDI